MDNLQWFKFSPADWMMGRIQRQPAQVQVDFLRVCCQYWKNEGNYFIEDAKLEAIESYETLLKFKIIKESNDCIVIDFLDEQLEGIEEKRKQASEAGKRSAEARKRRTESNDRSTTVKQPFNEPSTKSNRVEKSREDKEQHFEDSSLNDAFDDFKLHRKQLKKPMTEKAIELAVKKLQKVNEKVAIEMIQQSIENGWSGLFEVKEQAKKKTTSEHEKNDGFWSVNWKGERYLTKKGVI